MLDKKVLWIVSLLRIYFSIYSSEGHVCSTNYHMVVSEIKLTDRFYEYFSPENQMFEYIFLASPCVQLDLFGKTVLSSALTLPLVSFVTAPVPVGNQNAIWCLIVKNLYMYCKVHMSIKYQGLFHWKECIFSFRMEYILHEVYGCNAKQKRIVMLRQYIKYQ